MARYPALPQRPAFLAEYPGRYGPMLAYTLEQSKHRGLWIGNADYAVGQSDICRIQWEVIMGAQIDRLIAGQEATYRLLNATFNGQAYSSTPDVTEPSGFLTTPPIPQSPATYDQAVAEAAKALRSTIQEARVRDSALIDRDELRRVALGNIQQELVNLNIKLQQLLDREEFDPEEIIENIITVAETAATIAALL